MNGIKGINMINMDPYGIWSLFCLCLSMHGDFFVEYMGQYLYIWINLYMIRSLWLGLMGLIWSKISNNIQIMGSIICMCLSMHGYFCGILYMGQYLSIWINLYMIRSLWMGLMGLIWSIWVNMGYDHYFVCVCQCMEIFLWNIWVNIYLYIYIWINMYMIRSLWLGLMGLIWSKISNNLQIMGSIICMCLSMHGHIFCGILYMGQYLSIWINLYMIRSLWMGLMGFQ